MNTRTKGNRLELKAQRILEGWGYTAWRPTGRARHGSSDIFGAFDILASQLGHRPMLVQVGVISMAAAKRRQVESASEILDDSYVQHQVWCWDARAKHFRRWEWVALDAGRWVELEVVS